MFFFRKLVVRECWNSCNSQQLSNLHTVSEARQRSETTRPEWEVSQSLNRSSIFSGSEFTTSSGMSFHNFIQKKVYLRCWYCHDIITKKSDGFTVIFGNLWSDSCVTVWWAAVCWYKRRRRSGREKRGTNTAFDLLTYTMLRCDADGNVT